MEAPITEQLKRLEKRMSELEKRMGLLEKQVPLTAEEIAKFHKEASRELTKRMRLK